MAPVIAVDLGGTSLRIALFASLDPDPAAQTKLPTRASEGPDSALARMIEAIEQLLPSSAEGLRIGIGAPGPLDPQRGVILETPNLPGWINVPVKDRLANHFGCTVAVGNDASLAALGEWRFGAGRGSQNMLYLTISTGIGGGAIVDGRPLLGALGLGAELGHMTVEPEGPLCGCGQRGHLEAVASGLAIARRAHDRVAAGEESSLANALQESGRLTAKHVAQAAQQGDRLAREEMTRAAEAIGKHLASLVHAFNPEVIVLGGGVTQAGPLFLDPIEKTLLSHLMHRAFAEDLRLLPAALGDDAGLIGAMILGYGE
ncbi:MAG: ROK family protein [Anaerolineales bacterium]|jgi:glucokinase